MGHAYLKQKRRELVKMEFEQVLCAFEDYIKNNDHLDVVKTKFGYAVLHYSPKEGRFIYEPELIRNSEALLQCLREEIVLDVLHGTGRNHDLESADPDELVIIERITKECLRKLSEHVEYGCCGTAMIEKTENSALQIFL